jgi:hypothetical protein
MLLPSSPRIQLLVWILTAGLSLVVHSVDATEQRSATVCAYLRFELGQGIVQLENDEYYTTAMANPYSLFNTVYRPSCVVVPTNSAHVQAAMKAIYRGRVRYAVQAGGHSGMTGWNKCVVYL